MSWIAIVLIVIGVWIAIKAAGALLKTGLAQYGLQQVPQAEASFQQVLQRYPGTDAARTAQDRLRAIELSRMR